MGCGFAAGLGDGAGLFCDVVGDGPEAGAGVGEGVGVGVDLAVVVEAEVLGLDAVGVAVGVGMLVLGDGAVVGVPVVPLEGIVPVMLKPPEVVPVMGVVQLKVPPVVTCDGLIRMF